MRKLGKGQSVVFCVSEEIQTKIHAIMGGTNQQIDVRQVLLWAMSETFTETRRAMPLWAVQNERYLGHKQLWHQARSIDGTTMTEQDAKEFLEAEAQGIEGRYCPRSASDVIPPPPRAGVELNQIHTRCGKFKDLNFDTSVLQEEQERELSPEVEQERQIQRPAPAKALDHRKEPHVSTLIQTGELVPGSKVFVRAFEALADTSAATHLDLPQLKGNGDLLVTTDFINTVHKSRVGYRSDSYQRSVQWVLTTYRPNTNEIREAVVISPFEASQFLPLIRKSENVTLHVYRPRCNRSHPALDELEFMTIPERAESPVMPRSLRIQLDLFAGQLYLGSYDDYREVCSFLGLAIDSPQGAEEHGPDGFIVKNANGVATTGKSPVPFLQVLMSKIRRDGQGIGRTHIGKILDGCLLLRADIEGEQRP